jgi:hypothetical protein
MTFWRALKGFFSSDVSFDPSRRRLFGIAAGGVVAAVALPHLPSTMIAGLFDDAFTAVGKSGLYAELAAVTRRAYVPRMFVQLYTTNPMLSLLTEKQ